MRASFLLLSALLITLTFAAALSTRFPLLNKDSPTSSLDSLVSLRAPVVGAATDPNKSLNESANTEPTMSELVELAKQLLAHMRRDVRDYTATLVKRERISGKLAPEARIEIKIRNPRSARDAAESDKPPLGLAAYLRFTEPAAMRGREVIWVEDKNDGQLIAHESGFLNLLRVELDPQSTLAMMGNKYPITEIGLMRLLEQMLEKIDRGVDLSSCLIETRDGQRVGDRECRLIQITQPRSVPGADFYIAQFFLDSERQLPLRYAAFLWPEKEGDPPLLEEEYTYLDLKLNVGLSDSDFDPNNANYDYP